MVFNKFDKRKLVLLTLGVVLIATPVLAQSTSVFESISSVFGNQKFDVMYTQHWWIIDLIIYLFFFGFIGKLTLGQQFDRKGGPLGVIVGVALAIAVVYFESTSGFRLGNIGPFGLAIALIIFAIVVHKFFSGLLQQQGQGINYAAFAWTFVAIYGFLLTVASQLFTWIKTQNNPWLNVFSAVLNILLLISVVAIIWQIFRIVPNLFNANLNIPGIGGNPPAANPQQPAPAAPAAAQVAVGNVINQLNAAAVNLQHVQQQLQAGQQVQAQQLRQLLQQIIQIDTQLQQAGVHVVP